MPAMTITLNIHLAVDGGELRIRSADATGPSGRVLSVLPEPAVNGRGDQDEGETLDARVHRLLEDRSPRSKVALYRSYLERCVRELGAQPAPPGSGERDYVNVNPPSKVRGGRLSALTVSTGRLALHSMAPEMAERWSAAEVVTVNGQPSYVRIYLRDGSHVEQAVDMTRAVLEER